MTARLRRDIAGAFRLPERVSVAEWVPASIVVPDELETPGAFDLNHFPHVLGVLEAADDPQVREIYLRWSTRNAKTFTALCILLCLVSQYQRPGMLGSADEERVDDLIANEVYPILEACGATRPQLLQPWLRSMKKGVVLAGARIRRAFAKSRAKLAGFPACYGVCNEAGLWPMNAINRFRQRARLFPFDSLLIYEGKPETEGECSISALVEAETTQRRYRFVQCPHCKLYQRLQWGDGKQDSPGIKYNSGKSSTRQTTDQRLARESAYYRCENGCRITSGERAKMMRTGKWVPEGCTISSRGTIKGTPLVEGRNVAFDELSALYSLGISGWGQLVSEWLDAQGNEESLREFTTGTLAKKWQKIQRVVEPSAVAVRLKDPTPIDRVPEWAVFLTRAIDVQTVSTGIECPWGICAWGGGGRGQLVAYGVAHGWHAVRHMLTGQDLRTVDGEIMRPAWTVIDSGDGHVQEEVYEICRQYNRTLPSKGSSHPFPMSYRLGLLNGSRSGTQTELRRMATRGTKVLFEVNSERSQRWIQKHLEGQTAPDDKARFSLALEAALDESLIDELCNEQETNKIDKQGFVKKRWTKKNAGTPNDMRDVIRYCWTLAQFVTNDGANWDSLPARQIHRAVTGTAQPTVRERSQVPELLQGGGRRWPGA